LNDQVLIEYDVVLGPEGWEVDGFEVKVHHLVELNGDESLV
jgi:hypothetical protein